MSAKKSGQSGNSKSSTNRRSSKSTASKSTASKKTSTTAKSNKAGKAARQPILESAIRLEVVGIILVVLAIALFIAVVAPGDALVTVAVSSVLHMLFGVGALALPFLLAAWAASFFVRQPPSASRLRLSLGLLTIFLAALTMISLNTANAVADPMRVFESSNLLSHGGYLGAAIAWMLLSLVGYAIAMVIGIGAVIIGAVLIGFSLVSLAERLNSLFKARSIEAPASTGPYDLGEELDQPRTKRWQRGPGQAAQDPYDDGLLTPTAKLAAESQSMSAANTWAGFADDIYDDELDNLQDDPELGVTRRLVGREKRLQKADDQALAESADLSSSPELAIHPVDKQPEYQLPSMDLLKISRSRATSRAVDAELKAVAAELQETLQQFQVDAQVVGWTAGPTVTLYKLALGEGVRVARITSLSDDIALALAASSVRIFSPIPGTSLVGVEVPNAERSLVLLGDVLPQAPSGALQLAIGKDVEGASIVANLAGMPHLLIGGTTGSGKSVAINSMIMSMLMRTTPAEVRMILIDPKMVELTRYNDIPHLYVPVVTDAAKAAASLAWSVLEMEHRLKLFMDAGVKNIAAYNEQVRKTRAEAISKAEKTAQRQASKAQAAAQEQAAARELAAQAAAQEQAAAQVLAQTTAQEQAPYGQEQAPYGQEQAPDLGFYADHAENDFLELEEPHDLFYDQAADQVANLPADQAVYQAANQAADQPAEIELELPADLPEELPLVVIVIDELADLMIVAGKDVEASVTRLSQLARAAGLHLIIATQRPSTNVITGVIKANIVNRIAFNVGSGIDSRVILDTTGAESLLGNGDLLFSKPEYGKPTRIQGCFVSEAEINEVTSFWKSQGQPNYHEEILATAVGGLSTYHAGSMYEGADSDDPLVWDAADIVVTTQMGSTSTLQRRLKVGYARAGRIMDNLEQKGIVGPANGSKPREVLVDDILDLESLRAIEAAD